jgi:ribosomal protein L31
MKPGIHPDYRPVVFRDGGRRIVDSAGQVEKFNRRYGSQQPSTPKRDAQAAQ